MGLLLCPLYSLFTPSVLPCLPSPIFMVPFFCFHATSMFPSPSFLDSPGPTSTQPHMLVLVTHVSVYTFVLVPVHGGQSNLIPWGSGVSGGSPEAPKWVVGIKPGSSAKAVCNLNHRATAPAP